MPIFAGSFDRIGRIPLVQGLDKADAEQMLRNAGFSVDILPDGRYSSEVEAGKILVQYPVAGRKVKLGRTIRLTLSKGLREVAVPDLRGRSKKQAEMSLSRSGFVIGDMIKGSHESIPRGVIIRTVPEAGTLVRIGDTVQIVISSGGSSGKVLLPSFEGLLLEDVLNRLNSLGFQIGKIERILTTDHPSNIVLSQSPMSGEYLAQDSKINLVISD